MPQSQTEEPRQATQASWDKGSLKTQRKEEEPAAREASCRPGTITSFQTFSPCNLCLHGHTQRFTLDQIREAAPPERD